MECLKDSASSVGEGADSRLARPAQRRVRSSRRARSQAWLTVTMGLPILFVLAWFTWTLPASAVPGLRTMLAPALAVTWLLGVIICASILELLFVGEAQDLRRAQAGRWAHLAGASLTAAALISGTPPVWLWIVIGVVQLALAFRYFAQLRDRATSSSGVPRQP